MLLSNRVLTALAGISGAHGALLWDGRFNDIATATDLNRWSWANQTGPYQYYIHGNDSVEQYIALSSDFKNPSDTTSTQGAKFTLDSSAYWNGQDMRRIELIPQTAAKINESKVFYHFSMMRKDTNAPNAARLHKYAFFEAGFSEMNSGWTEAANETTNPTLRWAREHVPVWEAEWVADVWHNVAYEVDFVAKTVGFWHSTDGDDLELAVAPVVASTTSSMGADWHLGHLELPRDGQVDGIEDVYFSGTYIESDTLTKAVSG